jgi:hypothetical protein
MGFSLGARVIFACLEELAKKGDTGNPSLQVLYMEYWLEIHFIGCV